VKIEDSAMRITTKKLSKETFGYIQMEGGKLMHIEA
jgi:hypothetical protein